MFSCCPRVTGPVLEPTGSSCRNRVFKCKSSTMTDMWARTPLQFAPSASTKMHGPKTSSVTRRSSGWTAHLGPLRCSGHPLSKEYRNLSKTKLRGKNTTNKINEGSPVPAQRSTSSPWDGNNARAQKTHLWAQRAALQRLGSRAKRTIVQSSAPFSLRENGLW